MTEHFQKPARRSAASKRSGVFRLAVIMKPYLFLFPLLFFGFWFVYFPFIRTFLYSFSRVNFRGDITAFTGLRNFRRLFGDPVFFTALTNTLCLTCLVTALLLVISYGLALLAEKKRKAGTLYETLFMLPMAVSMAAASQIFKLLLDPAVGILNHTLSLDAGWFSDPKTALLGIAMVCVWVGIPFDFLLFLSALRNIPSQVREAAEIDGIQSWRKLVFIQIPLTSPVMFYVICTNMALAMMTSTPVMILTGGQPEYSTVTLIFMMYTSGYQSSNYSLASCISLAAFALTFGLVFLAFVFERKRAYYQ